ncbi:leucine-rich repeat protein [Perkinsela sp. CCAP 1560/4]|nr:leucine-rich repeat protein [Perkinsela sp. CCAP 1560/4]|eukprot:KNH03741.1 leucine-rich repeat protein [Perkinsela sp. CCAP 1560/4]
MYAVVFFTCSDNDVGRVDRASLPQQALMELFIFGLNEPEEICGSRDNPDDVCEWQGVKCNGDREVEDFHWGFKWDNGTGTLGLEFLPPSMKVVAMYQNALYGTFQLADLPKKMEVVCLFENQLTGSLDLDSLPAVVRSLQLSKNEFTGDISLENLPKCLKELELAENQLSGTICLTSLPPALQVIHLKKNNFEGSLDFTRLPASMKVINLSENRFSGTIDLGNLPESMVNFDVRNNALSRTVRMPKELFFLVSRGTNPPRVRGKQGPHRGKYVSRDIHEYQNMNSAHKK